MEDFNPRPDSLAESTNAVANVIDKAIEEVEQGDAVTETTVNINGKTLTLDEAIEELRKQTDIPVFDSTQPRVVEPVTINLGGREMHLRLPFWALRRFEKATGVSPWDHEQVWKWPPKMDHVVHLLWAALLDENPDITVEEVERLEGMEFANVHYIRRKLDECWGRNANSPTQSSPGSNGQVPNR